MTINNYQQEIKHVVISCHEQLANIFLMFEQENGCSTIFESYLWLNVWSQHYWQPHWQLNCIAYYQDDTLIAIAPFYLNISTAFPYVKSLHFIGQGEPEAAEVSAEYLDIQIKTGYEATVLPLLAKNLAALRFDVLSVKAILTNSHIAKLLLLLKGKTEKRNYCRYSVDRSRWSFQQLSKNTRSRIKRTKNQLSQYDYDTRWLSQQEIKNTWPALAMYHQKRWLKKGGLGAFNTDAFNAFHLTLINEQPNSVKMCAIFINNIPVAINYYLVDKSALYFYQSGWDEENYAALSPGFYLHYWAIENCASKAYDFMMGGIKDSYKAKFSETTQPMQSFSLVKNEQKIFIQKVINKIKKSLFNC